MSMAGALIAGTEGIAQGIMNAANYTARAAARANGISKQAQTQQGMFNQASADSANDIGTDRIAQQYAFNSAQAAAANDFTREMWGNTAAWNEMMWQRSADWNERMWNKQAEFNAEQAQINRDWQEKMRNTAYQSAVKDMTAAGLNPILAVTGGGIQTGSGAGGAASVGMGSTSAPSMSSAQGAMASGSLLQGLSASESSYSGQQEYMGGLLGLLSAGISGLSTALQVMGADKNINLIIKTMADELLNTDETVTEGRKEEKEHNENSSLGEKIKDGIRAYTNRKNGTTLREWYGNKMWD